MVKDKHGRKGKEFPVPTARPILYELFCPSCEGPLFAVDDDIIEVGRSELDYGDIKKKVDMKRATHTITRLECLKCSKTFEMKTIGIRYAQNIASQIGWPFPELALPKGPYPKPRYDSAPAGDEDILGHYANRWKETPSDHTANILRCIMNLGATWIPPSEPVDTIAASELPGSYIARIDVPSLREGLRREQLPSKVSSSDLQIGDIIELVPFRSSREVQHEFYLARRDGLCHILTLVTPGAE